MGRRLKLMGHMGCLPHKPFGWAFSRIAPGPLHVGLPLLHSIYNFSYWLWTVEIQVKKILKKWRDLSILEPCIWPIFQRNTIFFEQKTRKNGNIRGWKKKWNLKYRFWVLMQFMRLMLHMINWTYSYFLWVILSFVTTLYTVIDIVKVQLNEKSTSRAH